MKLTSPAKINLTLDILGKDERVGKHFVNSVMLLYDELYDEIELNENGTVQNSVWFEGSYVGAKNTVTRALDLMSAKGWDVVVKKHIPLQSGLGGGSSNAASILRYFGEKKGISEFELQKLGAQIGADVPFFLCEGNLAYCEGFGDQVVQSWTVETPKIELVKTGIAVSSADAYAGLNLEECGRHSVKTDEIVKVLNNGSCQETWSQQAQRLFHNDFEEQFFNSHPEWRGKGNLCGSGGWMWRMLSF